jgi:hypothetical protein
VPRQPIALALKGKRRPAAMAIISAKFVIGPRSLIDRSGLGPSAEVFALPFARLASLYPSLHLAPSAREIRGHIEDTPEHVSRFLIVRHDSFLRRRL